MKNIRIEQTEAGVWEIYLSRGDKLNALSLEMISELTEAFQRAHEAAEKYECRALIVASDSPKAFCVGADLSERLKMSDDEVLSALDALKKLTLALENVPCPTISVVAGAAFGGGLELALCSDIRAFSTTAQVGLVETRLAIIPGAGGTQRLSRLLGPAKAKELIFAAEKINAEESARLGLCHSVSADPLAWSREYAAKCLECGPVALLAAKQAIDNGMAHASMEAALEYERQAYLKTLKTKDRLEGLKAFQEKRKPVYKGL